MTRMKSLKITHFFDVIKKEPVREDDNNVSSAMNEHTDVKQEYHYKEELDLTWDEGDNDYGINQENRDFLNDSSYKLGYPIVLLERLPNDLVKKYVHTDHTDQSETEIGTLDATKCNRNSFLQYYRKFCPDCDKRQSSKKINQKCKNCDTLLNYECIKCRKQLPSYGGIINHLISKCIEKGYYFACFECNYKSISKYEVNRHLKTVHSTLHALNRIEKFESENVQNDVISAAKLHKCSKCEKQFQKLPPLLRHMQICGQEKYNAQPEKFAATVNVVQDRCTHHCVKCNRTVKNDKIGTFHLKKCQICHSKFSFKCKECNQIFHSYNGLNQHLKISHTVSEDVFKCPECDFQTHYIEYLTKHVRRKHFVETHECPKCNGKYKNRSAFKDHSRHCKKEPEFQCDHCPHRSKTKMSLKIHIFQVHTKGNDIECPQCGITLKNKLVLKAHIKYCKKQPCHECNSCSFRTKYKYDLTKHCEDVHSHNQKEETCPRCAKKCKNKTSLRSHLQGCGKRSDFSCNHCFHLFKTKSNLTQHIIRVHSEDDNVDIPSKPLYLHCNDCTYKTRFKGDLVKHVITHSEDNARECPTCGKQFKNEYFKRHEEYCGKEQPRCNLCNFKTSNKDSLRKHILNVHSKGNEINCSKCGKTCKNKSYLRAHLQRCGTDPQFKCDHCVFKTKYKYVLRKHIEKTHIKKRRLR